jgi:hypothetical protein
MVRSKILLVDVIHWQYLIQNAEWIKVPFLDVRETAELKSHRN